MCKFDPVVSRVSSEPLPVLKRFLSVTTLVNKWCCARTSRPNMLADEHKIAHIGRNFIQKLNLKVVFNRVQLTSLWFCSWETSYYSLSAPWIKKKHVTGIQNSTSQFPTIKGNHNNFLGHPSKFPVLRRILKYKHMKKRFSKIKIYTKKQFIRIGYVIHFKAWGWRQCCKTTLSPSVLTRLQFSLFELWRTSARAAQTLHDELWVWITI